MFMLTVIGCASLAVFGASLPIFNYDRASDQTVKDKSIYLERIQTLLEDRAIDDATFVALHEEQASVPFQAHLVRRETFRDPMTLYPLLAAHTPA